MKHPIIIKNNETKNRDYFGWDYVEEYVYYDVNYFLNKKRIEEVRDNETSDKNI